MYFRLDAKPKKSNDRNGHEERPLLGHCFHQYHSLAFEVSLFEPSSNRPHSTPIPLPGPQTKEQTEGEGEEEDQRRRIVTATLMTTKKMTLTTTLMTTLMRMTTTPLMTRPALLHDSHPYPASFQERQSASKQNRL